MTVCVPMIPAWAMAGVPRLIRERLMSTTQQRCRELLIMSILLVAVSPAV
jgi:hypothetical protein